MSSSPDILLDVTTHYSILGLSSDAAENDIHKSYMKLARLLHPDKSRSDATGEQFKLVSHAHYILMDKEQRIKYDETLQSKGLLRYQPKGKCHKFVKTSPKDSKNSKPASKTYRAAKHHQPYEQQPYGFGTDNSKSSNPHPKVPIFQSFNLKNYQRKQKSARGTTPEEPSTGSHSNPFNQQHDHEDIIGEQKVTPPPSRRDPDKTRTHINETEILDSSSDETNDMEEAENLRWKMHKPDASRTQEEAPGSPFSDNQHRHYARKKHEAKVRGRRSTSPIKTVPTTKTPDMSESWNGLKNILDNFPSLKDTSAERTKRTDANRERITPISVVEASAKVRKTDRDSIRLDDLGTSLPPDDDSFDMQKVSDILDDVPTVKRAKKDFSQNSDIEMKSPPKSIMSRVQVKNSAYSSHISETLHMPVNQPLPKVYKTDTIALDQYRINSKVAQWELPAMPIFQCNLLDSNEVEHCKRSVLEFNARCNALKQNLLTIMHDRLKADQELDERLVKIENAANWVSCKDFDFEVVNKLSELQNRQRIVAQSFVSLLKSVYATGH